MIAASAAAVLAAAAADVAEAAVAFQHIPRATAAAASRHLLEIIRFSTVEARWEWR